MKEDNLDVKRWSSFSFESVLLKDPQASLWAGLLLAACISHTVVLL